MDLSECSSPERTIATGTNDASLMRFLVLYEREAFMPDQETLERAREDAREGKAPSTQAGEFVREEMHHIREGKHGAASTKQAIAIGLSKTPPAGGPIRPRSRRGGASPRSSSPPAPRAFSGPPPGSRGGARTASSGGA